ncbi:tRNA glutamyl-Q(34) synthetase GluQRS, partial [Rhizobiaceae sp. 2RAB30]
PSPNGELHLGHAYSALLNAKLAKATGGRFLLRIEDIDTTRCTPEFESAIYQDLAWLGVDWEQPVRRQSEHFAEYRVLLDRLIRAELVYPAFMSRSEIRAHIADQETRRRHWPHDPDGAPLYPGIDKQLSKRERRRRIDRGDAFAWRLDMEAVLGEVAHPLFWREAKDESLAAIEHVDADPGAWGDVVIARKDVPTSYHLSVVADDAVQDITHVVRGRDLYLATAIQRVLQELFGFPAPVYFHHGLVHGPDGRKLSKSLRDSGIRALREAGKSPSEIRHMIDIE